MRRQQRERLVPLVSHAYETVPWYRSRFDQLGIRPQQLAEESAWRSLPPVTRFDIQQAGRQLHSTAAPATHGRVSTQWTSGSTAAPVMVLRTEQTSAFWIAITLRHLQWQSCNLADKLAVIRSVPRGQADPPAGARYDTWGIATARRMTTGPCVVLDVRTSIAEQAAWLAREQPAYLQTYPSIAFELARHSLEHGRQPMSLRQVLTFGEVAEPHVRQACRQAWGATLLDAYSTNEVGYIAAQCDQCSEYHVQAENLLVEILDENGRDCAAGEVGRVVITDLFNYAMPLLRYEIGDYAEVGGPCPCGRKLPTLRRILGRQRNMFLLLNGEKRWPAFDADVLGAFQGQLPVRQFQMIQHRRDEVEAKLVAARALTVEEEAGIRAVLAECLGTDVRVRFSYVDAIARGPHGKYEDYRCSVDSSS